MRTDPTMISDLLFFRAAATNLSFIKAASHLSVTQSAVSQRIQRLEARLGVTLFLRHKKGIRLTEQGELLFGAVRGAFNAVDDAVQAVQAFKSHRPVVISCGPSLAIEWLATKLVDIYERHPEIPVSLYGDFDPELSDELADDAFDIAIYYGPNPPEMGVVQFECVEELFPVISPKLLERLTADAQERVTLLHDASPWPHVAQRDAEWQAWINRYDQPIANPTRDTFANLVQLCYRTAVAGGGVAMGRKLVAHRYLDRGQLIRFPNAPGLFDIKYFVITRPGPLRADVRVVLDWLKHEMISDLAS